MADDRLNFLFSCRRVFLLSSPVSFSSFVTERRNKKGATVSERWTPTRGTYPLDSSPREQRGHLTAGCSRPYLAVRGERATACGKVSTENQALRPDKALRTGSSLPIRKPSRPDELVKAANSLPVSKALRPDKLAKAANNFPTAGEPFHPACRVRPGAGLGLMACRLPSAGDLGVRPPGRRPPIERVATFSVPFWSLKKEHPPGQESKNFTAGKIKKLTASGPVCRRHRHPAPPHRGWSPAPDGPRSGPGPPGPPPPCGWCAAAPGHRTWCWSRPQWP